jgi:hypothetical protein
MKIRQNFPSTLLFSLAIALPNAVFAGSYSTQAVSEEDPPATCDIGDPVYAATCRGSYCDNTNLWCEDKNYPVIERRWTPNFSEEEPLFYGICNYREIMTGISFAGRYGDNVSIECSAIPRSRTDCRWTRPLSEEQGYQYFDGQFLNEVACYGRYCDNRRYLVCSF